jgi:hypothetical protein
MWRQVDIIFSQIIEALASSLYLFV